MKKSRKWIPLFTLFILVWFVLDYILYPQLNTLDTTIVWFNPHVVPNIHLESFIGVALYQAFPNNGNLDDVIFLLSHSLIILYELVIFIGVVFIVIYYMLKWTTQYNLDTFEYKSKREWKKATTPQTSIVEKIKQYSNSSFENIKDISKKTNEKIPSEKIKETSAKTIEKISETAKNLKSEPKIDDDYIKKQIREWHNMMIMGVITELDFEKKKTELLKLDKNQK